MEINIFIICYNEEILLPHTIAHYKKHLPTCTITIYDNESTDNSVKIAESLNCNIISWNSNNIIDDGKYIEIKNNCWKKIKSGWVIVCDMDEWLYVDENELLNEKGNILQIQGYDIVGESENEDLSDISLSLLNKGILFNWESKKLCFLREAINEMNYGIGAHNCNPEGSNIIYSANIYKNKHMSNLGLPFLINKIKQRYIRSEKMRKNGLCTHYINDINKIKQQYLSLLNTCCFI